MSLPVFLKSKTFLVFVFVGTLALGAFSVVGAYLLKKGAGRQEVAKAQTPNTCPTFQINPTSAAANWPNLITTTTELFLNCSSGQNYDLAYFVQQTNPPGPRFKTEPSGSFHTKPCGSGGIVADTFEIKKENLKDYNTEAPAVPTCAGLPCDYKIYVRWSAGSGDPWKDHSSCQANFQITPQLPSCTKFEVLKNEGVVTTISPNDQIDLKAIGSVGSFAITKVKFYYKKNGGSSAPVLIGEGQKTGSEHGVETWMYRNWTVPATFANGESYDFYAEPEDDHGNKCNPYQNASICGNCKTTVTVSVTPTFSCAISPATFNVAPGGSQSLTATPTGGTPPYTYSWSAAGGTITGTGATVAWTAPANATAGTTYTIPVTVTDASTPQKTATCHSVATITTAPSHKVCQGETCTTVSGAGTDQCQTNTECQHTAPLCRSQLVIKNATGGEITSAKPGDTVKITATATHSSNDNTKLRKAFFFYQLKLTPPNYCLKPLDWLVLGPQEGVSIDTTKCTATGCPVEYSWAIPAATRVGDYALMAKISDATGALCTGSPSGPCVGETATACGLCAAIPGSDLQDCTGCNKILSIQTADPPKCKGFTLNKTQTKDTEEVTANLTINSGSSGFKEGQVFIHAATAEELKQNNQHYIGPLTFFNGKTGEQTTTFSFVPKTFNVGGGANIVWLTIENTSGQACTDRPAEYPVGRPNWPLCGCGAKNLTVTICPTCQGIQMTPAGGTVSAGSPITFVATFKRGSKPSPTVSFQITKPGGTKETITCPKASPECTITSSGEQIVATLKYLPATAGQYLAKASASCGGTEAGVHLKLEAESGTEQGGMQELTESAASACKHVNILQPTPPATEPTGSTSLTVSIPKEGDYYLWGRTKSASWSQNSFYVKEGSTEIPWEFAPSDAWQWGSVCSQAQNLCHDPYLWHFSQGNHTLIIRAREALAKLDALEITDQSPATYQPSWATACSTGGQ